MSRSVMKFMLYLNYCKKLQLHCYKTYDIFIAKNFNYITQQAYDIFIAKNFSYMTRRAYDLQKTSII